MPTNVEIKARAHDPQRQQALAAQLTPAPPEVVHQYDTFFAVPSGRLKLREFSPNQGQLIFYAREDVPGPKSSAYQVSTTDAPAALRSVLAAALGVCGEVRKRRTIYLVGQTRVHFDQVERLGDFVELEVVLQTGQTLLEATAIAEDLMRSLEIRSEQLISGSYLDLMHMR